MLSQSGLVACALAGSACMRPLPKMYLPATPIPICPTVPALPPDGGSTVVDAGRGDIPLDTTESERADAESPRPPAEEPHEAGRVDTDAGAGVGLTSEGPCPSDMKLVDTTYCPKIQRKCLDEEYSPQNKITLCHRFAKEQRCLVPEEHRRFCMDEFEYPNRAGAHPPWMVSWYDAQATCGLQHKRVCYESEWVTACEGPEKTPFPYGFSRDNAACNIDNYWIKPSLEGIYSKDPQVALRELSKLDQSVPSGARERCVSGFGIHDMTGNFDEWVTADAEHDDKSRWAGLKGGAWGHVRNACRPVTTSHPPDFTYYFIAFRCCKDAADAPAYVPESSSAIPEVPPADRAPLPTPIHPPGPSKTKVRREHWGR